MPWTRCGQRPDPAEAFGTHRSSQDVPVLHGADAILQALYTGQLVANRPDLVRPSDDLRYWEQSTGFWHRLSK